MVYGYARVSTKGQAVSGNSLEDQEKQLQANGADVIYKDSYTGTKLERPQFDELRSVIKEGDTLLVTKLDRIARSALHGSELVQTLINDGIKVNVLNMGVMDNSPTGKLIMNVMFAFAEFERDMIVQRTMEGKEVARLKEDYVEGRPKKQLDPELFEELLTKQRAGEMSVADCCKELQIARGTWYSKVKELAV